MALTGPRREEIARILEIVARDGLPGPRDLDVALDAIEAAMALGDEDEETGAAMLEIPASLARPMFYDEIAPPDQSAAIRKSRSHGAASGAETMTVEEYQAMQAYIVTELGKRFGATMPPADEIKSALAEICSPIAHEPISVVPDPDQPGAIVITASVEMVEQLMKMKVSEGNG